MSYWLNGDKVDHVHVTDRGLAYGDGLFETIKVEAGRPLLLEQHLQRLALGLKRLAFDHTVIEHVRDELAAISLPQSAVLKITVTRGSGGRGYRQPDVVNASRLIAILPLPQFEGFPNQTGVAVRFCDVRLGLNPLLAGIKHLNRLEQVLARAEWSDAQFSEGLLCDIEGYLVEGTMSNLFWVKANCLYTPAIDYAGVDGIMRQQVMALAKNLGLDLFVGRYSIEELLLADEVFVTNSLIDIWPVTSMPKWQRPVGRVTSLLQEKLQQEYMI